MSRMRVCVCTHDCPCVHRAGVAARCHGAGAAQVSTILVNIFGGIMRCDDIALGIIKAASMLGIRKKSIVIRLYC